MKKMFVLMFILVAVMMSCAPIDVKVEADNSFKITVEDEDKTVVDINCKVGLEMSDGVKNYDECIGYFEKDGNSYRCSVAFDFVRKLPEKDKLTVKENCEIVVKK